ncbi:hypothetical protein JOM56_009207, partial [Amanita muscaria]
RLFVSYPHHPYSIASLPFHPTETIHLRCYPSIAPQLKALLVGISAFCFLAMRRKRRKLAPSAPNLLSKSAPRQERHPASAPPMPPPKIMLAPIVGFMMEFGKTLKRHSQLHHRHILAWRMIRLTKDLNKVLLQALQESPSCITASYANATPLPVARELHHPRRPRVQLGPQPTPGPIAKSEPPRPPHTMHSGPPRTPAHFSLPNVHTFNGLDHTLVDHVGLHFERRAYPICAVMLGRPLHTGLLLNHCKTFIMMSHEEGLTHPLTILGHQIEHHGEIFASLFNLTALITRCTAMIPPQDHPDYVPYFARLLNEALLYALEDTHSRIRVVYLDDHTDQSIRAFRRGRRLPKGHPLGLRLDDLVTAQLCAWTIAQSTRTSGKVTLVLRALNGLICLSQGNKVNKTFSTITLAQ